MSSRFIAANLDYLLDDKTVCLVAKIAQQCGISEVHRWQSHALQALLHGKDVIIKAGTGRGKSLIFQGMALTSPKAIVLVVCPLVALMDDQACTEPF